MIEQKPYALSCDRNTEHILKVFQEKLVGKNSFLEVGAGTGQHAISMAPHFPDMVWTLTDRKENHPGISLWLRDFPRANVRGPLEYEIGQSDFPSGDIDVVFCANVLHIISWDLCLELFQDMGESLKKGTVFIAYGAYNYDGKFTSESNEKFNQWLIDRDPQSAIRDFEKVCDELRKRGFDLQEDIEMPANNRMLFFEKRA
ncbi:MAG: DUF938 domain-containing protein [Pseudomonadota bacterium]